IRNHIEAVIPGFDRYNERVRQPGGFYLPNGAREGRWNTANGKANFTVNRPSELKLEEGELLMMTVRSHDQYNTTIYGLHDRYRGIFNERRVVLMHPDDLQQHDLRPGDVVDLVGHYEGQERWARRFIAVPYDIPTRCIATYFPEANSLVPLNSIARTSHTPTSKSVIVRVQKTGESVPLKRG
ncbi:MAG: molybdopterin dinucleotide binding domain-containing protein, partial [Bacteroidota bacterium]